MNELGLRERKVAESRLRAEVAAIDLCLEHGYCAVTVEMICDAAEISPRTFYNYFGTREAALLGQHKPMPGPDAIEAYLVSQGGSEVEQFAALIASSFEDGGPDRQVVRRRRELLDKTPELATLNFARVTEARGRYSEIVARRMAVIEPASSDQDRELKAQYIVAVTMGAMQIIGRGWLHGNTDAPISDYLDEAFVMIRAVTQTSR